MECAGLPIVKSGEFAARLTNGNARPALVGSFEVTGRCNFRCAHCYIRTAEHHDKALRHEISGRQFRRIIDEIADHGCLQLLLTGGEPFIREDFLDLYIYTRKKGILVSIFTNGSLINPKIADKLAEYGPSLVEITLYGSSEDTFDTVAGVKGAYAGCMNAIDLLMHRNICLGLKSTVTSVNKHELSEMRDFASGLGLEFRFDAMITPRLDGRMYPLEFRISAEESAALDRLDQKREQDIRAFINREISIDRQPDRLFQCGAGRNSFHMDSAGKLSVCMMFRSALWDVCAHGFKQGWTEFIPAVIVRKRSRLIECTDCGFYPFCGQCPGWAWLESGDAETRVDYLCELAHLRAKMFGEEPTRSCSTDDNVQQLGMTNAGDGL